MNSMILPATLIAALKMRNLGLSVFSPEFEVEGEK